MSILLKLNEKFQLALYFFTNNNFDTIFRKIGGNAHDAMKYLVAFWNAVDVRFKSLKEVKIHLSIAGIIIAGVS